jgi:lipoate-protein ligase A
MEWLVEHQSGTVAQLHASSAALVSPAGSSVSGLARTVRCLQPTDSALVLGSSQPDAVADTSACARAGVSVVRRRSGGGAVLVQPGAQLWVDLVVPANDPLSDGDVARAAWWVGEAWALALRRGGLAGAEAWKGRLQRRPWGSLVCFALLGAGEVTVPGVRAGTSGPRWPKVVGVSQRRTRLGALFQCSCLLRWEPAEVVALLALSPAQREQASRELRDVALAAPAGDGGQLLEELLAVLP